MNQCQICQNVNRQNVGEKAEDNPCFEARTYPVEYQPVKKRKETITLTCARFSHVHTAILYFRQSKKTAEER